MSHCTNLLPPVSTNVAPKQHFVMRTQPTQLAQFNHKRIQQYKISSFGIRHFLNWKNHVDNLLPKLSSACFVIRTRSSCGNIYALKMIYSAYFHSLLEYVIVFWGSSTNSMKAFKLQKRIIILMGSNATTCCRCLFPKLGIMTVFSTHIFYDEILIPQSGAL
jgi:hypothetical protein